MKTLGSLLCGMSFSIGIACLSSQTIAQNKPRLPSPLNASSSATEIVNWLDKNRLSHARIGLESGGPSLDPMESMMFTISEGLVFSSGFRLVKADGCRLTLRNDEVKVLSGWTNRTDSNEMSLANFVWSEKKGEKKLTPQSAVLFIPLDKMRYGKKPYQHTKNAEQAKLLGTWRTKYNEKGFFKRFVFQMEITAECDDCDCSDRRWLLPNSSALAIRRCRVASFLAIGVCLEGIPILLFSQNRTD